MQNIYGETVNLTAAQKREYVSLLSGKKTVFRSSRLYNVYNALVAKGLVKVTWATGNSTTFERWI